MRNYFRITILGMIEFFLVSLTSINKWDVPAELLGSWQSKRHKITVRTEPKLMKYEFTSDSTIVSLKINANKKVSGKIGTASFENGVLEKNSGNPKITGIAYIVKCGKIGKIFQKDPIESKTVEIWLSPVNGNMNAEIRYRENGSKFPMAGIILIPEKK